MSYPINEPNQAKRAAICGAQLRRRSKKEQKQTEAAAVLRSMLVTGEGGGGVVQAAGGSLVSEIVWHPGAEPPDHDRLVLCFAPDQAMDPVDPCRTWPGWFDGEGWTWADGNSADPPEFWAEIPAPKR